MDKQDNVSQIEMTTEEMVSDSGGLSLQAVEGLIKRKLVQIDELKETGTTYREMVESYLENDEEYLGLEEKAKEAAKQKSIKKKDLLAETEIAATMTKWKENKIELKELRASLSNDLYQFQKLSGVTEIEFDEGDLRQIVYVARLVKRSQQG